MRIPEHRRKKEYYDRKVIAGRTNRSSQDILRDSTLKNVYVDISWDEVAKYIVATPETTKNMAELMQRFPDRFLFGSDGAAPTEESKYLKVFHQYEPLWKSLDAETSRKVRLLNYERIFDEARGKVRRWESAHVSGASSN